MTIEITVAKIGRSMKKCDITCVPAAVAVGRGRRRARRGAGGGVSCGFTVMPGRARWMPATITRSPGFRPSRITRRPSESGPSFTGRYSTTFWSFTTRTYLVPWSVPTARSLTSSECVGSPIGNRTRTKSPGVRRRSVFSKTPRASIVPVAVFTWLSTKSMRPRTE